jgi:hypothetical protein
MTVLSHQIDVAFFGVWSQRRMGHFLYRPDGMTLPHFGPFIPESLDGRFNRPRFLHDSTLVPFKGYTLLAFDDQTADQRQGSNGCFLCDRDGMSKREVWTQADAQFPTITARLQAHVRLD